MHLMMVDIKIFRLPKRINESRNVRLKPLSWILEENVGPLDKAEVIKSCSTKYWRRMNIIRLFWKFFEPRGIDNGAISPEANSIYSKIIEGGMRRFRNALRNTYR